jgi:hypothetical protein
MFSGRHGRKRVTIASVKEVELPSDLAGVNMIQINSESDIQKDRGAFKRSIVGKIRSWVSEFSRSFDGPIDDVRDILPRLSDVMVSIIRNIKLKKGKSPYYNDIDLLASDMVGAVASAFDGDNYGMNDALIDKLATLHLPTCMGIHAIDVIGPHAWISPQTYRYLAPQIRKYIIANTNDKNQWHVQVAPPLAQALRTSVKNASERNEIAESLTRFDDSDFNWKEAETPRLEFSRILLWNKAELLSPVTKSIIAIHRLFNVPLFFLETNRSDPKRDIDFILFHMKDRTVEGFYGLKYRKYETNPINQQWIKPIGNPMDFYNNLLSHPHIMLAEDAYNLLISGE